MPHPSGILHPFNSRREEEVEAAILAESVTAAQVKKLPTTIGLAEPTGGWSCVFADGFGAPLGTAAEQDNFWYANRFTTEPLEQNQAGSNENELAVYNSSQVHVGPQGLEMAVTYSPGVGFSYKTQKNYLGAMVQGVNRTTMPAGYNFFNFLLGEGSTFAFEFVCKFPVNTGEMNNAMWSLGSPWLEEFDFWEAWGWNSNEGTKPTYNGGCTWLGTGEKSSSAEGSFKQAEQQIGLKFDPSQEFHRYTVVVFPNNTFSMYIDGVLQKSVGKFPSTGIIGPLTTINKVYQGLILQNTLRKFEEHFTSGTRTFFVRSAAVYQDTPHVGKHTQGGGTAYGTILV